MWLISMNFNELELTDVITEEETNISPSFISTTETKNTLASISQSIRSIDPDFHNHN